MQREAVRFQRRSGMRSRLATLLAAGACGAASAQASDPNPYFIGVSQGFTHDSNVFRVSDGAQSDNYSSTGLIGGIDQPFGRQRFFANGNVRLNRFSELDVLNNTSYGLNAGLDLSTIERLSGDVRLSINENLATYGTTNQLQLTKKNVQNTSRLQARVQRGMVSLLSVEAGYTHQRLRYSAVEYNRFETNQDAASLGLSYRPSGLLTLGTGVRHTRGDYPNVTDANGGDYSFTRNDLDLTAVWVPSGQSTVAGRISLGRQRYSVQSARDFSGTTGALTWGYRPTGKLTFTTRLSRDTGDETSFLTQRETGSSITGIADTSRLTNAFRFDAGYAATGKINVNAGVQYIRRSLANALALSNGTPAPAAEGRDTTTSFSLGATYAPTRNWLLACNVGRDSRSVSDGTPLFLSYPYNVNTASCSAQLSIQ